MKATRVSYKKQMHPGVHSFITESETVNMVFDVRWRQSKLKTPSTLEFLWERVLIYTLFPWSTGLLKDCIYLVPSRATHITSDMYQRILCEIIRILHKKNCISWYVICTKSWLCTYLISNKTLQFFSHAYLWTKLKCTPLQCNYFSTIICFYFRFCHSLHIL